VTVRCGAGQLTQQQARPGGSAGGLGRRTVIPRVLRHWEAPAWAAIQELRPCVPAPAQPVSDTGRVPGLPQHPHGQICTVMLPLREPGQTGNSSACLVSSLRHGCSCLSSFRLCRRQKLCQIHQTGKARPGTAAATPASPQPVLPDQGKGQGSSHPNAYAYLSRAPAPSQAALPLRIGLLKTPLCIPTSPLCTITFRGTRSQRATVKQIRATQLSS